MGDHNIFNPDRLRERLRGYWMSNDGQQHAITTTDIENASLLSELGDSINYSLQTFALSGKRLTGSIITFKEGIDKVIQCIDNSNSKDWETMILNGITNEAK